MSEKEIYPNWKTDRLPTIEDIKEDGDCLYCYIENESRVDYCNWDYVKEGMAWAVADGMTFHIMAASGDISRVATPKECAAKQMGIDVRQVKETKAPYFAADRLTKEKEKKMNLGVHTSFGIGTDKILTPEKKADSPTLPKIANDLLRAQVIELEAKLFLAERATGEMKSYFDQADKLATERGIENELLGKLLIIKLGG